MRCSTIFSAMLGGTSSYWSNCIVYVGAALRRWSAGRSRSRTSRVSGTWALTACALPRGSWPSTRPRRRAEVADHVAHELLRRDDLDREDRLEQDRLGALGRLLEGERAGDLEGDLRRVGVVVLAVDERDAHVDHRVAGLDAVLERLLDALLDRRDELGRDRAALDLVDEVEALAGRRLDVDVDDAVLARAAGLADELALDLLGRRRGRSRGRRPAGGRRSPRP